jgi:hypothetical protein
LPRASTAGPRKLPISVTYSFKETAKPEYHAVVFTTVDGRWEPTSMQRLPFMGERAGWPA